MPDTESDHHHGVAAVVRLDLVATPAAPATTTTSSCATTTATATARDEEKEEDGFTFAAAAVAVAVAIPRLQDADDCAFPDARVRAGPVYPVFGRPRWSLPKQQQDDEEEEEDHATAGTATVRVPLERLLAEEEWCNYAPSASGQQPADDAGAELELDGVPAETYCLWYPGASPAGSRRASPARCWTTGSTGSPPVLRWRRRSHSDGKDKFVFVGTSSDSTSAGEGQGWMNHSHGSTTTGGGMSSSTACLPCKQDLVELVASVVTCRRSCFLF